MQGCRVSEKKNVFWSLPVRGTNVFVDLPGGWDAKPPRNINVEKPIGLFT